MNTIKRSIGENIRQIRKEKGLSQDKLGELCHIKNTTISLYENSKKEPNLSTIAKIASALGVSIDRLYYGDSNKSFMPEETNEARRIVNAIYHLWKSKYILFEEGRYANVAEIYDHGTTSQTGLFLHIVNHAFIIKRLLLQLSDFEQTKSTYPNPEEQLEAILSSAAKAIEQEESNKE